MEYAIEFNNVWKSFRRGEKATLLRDAIPLFFNKLRGRKAPAEKSDFWALKNLSFKAKRGQILGIVGHNGAGKTTILKILSGIMHQSKGEIVTRGRMSCLIVAEAGFHPMFTGRENIYLSGSIVGLRKSEIDRKFDSIVEFAGHGLPDYKKFIDTPVKRYSSGMLVRLGFAVAAHVEPDILLVDEILAVGDIAFQEKCLEYMNDLKKSNTTIVMVSHSVSNIANYCDWAILLKNGEMTHEGEPHKVVSVFERELSKKMSWVSVGKVEEMRPVGGAVLSRVKIDSRQRLGNEMRLNHKDPIVVNFNCDCLKYPLDDVTLSLVAHRKADGCRCFNVLSHASGCYLNKRKNSVELVVKNHNLVPGQYVFDVEIKSLKAGRVIAIHREREVVIKSPDEYMNPGLYGVYQPENVSWKINPLSD